MSKRSFSSIATQTDFYQKNSLPTYLYYNPYDSSKSVSFHNTSDNAVDLYDVLTHEYISKGVTGETFFQVPATAAVVLVIIPSGSEISFNGKDYHVGNKIIDFGNPLGTKENSH